MLVLPDKIECKSHKIMKNNETEHRLHQHVCESPVVKRGKAMKKPFERLSWFKKVGLLV